MSQHLQFTGMAVTAMMLGAYAYTTTLARLSRRIERLESDRDSQARALRDLGELIAAQGGTLSRVLGRFEEHVELPEHGEIVEGQDGRRALKTLVRPEDPFASPRRRVIQLPPRTATGGDGETS